MHLTFHGAARTVTGSQHLVEVNGRRILLDCGLFQGRREESFARNQRLPFDARAIDVVVLSHAHIDHSGNLPNLIKSGFRGEVICTHATRDLCASMLPDSGHIQERDVEFVNKKRARKGEPPTRPIYTQDDAYAALDSFTAIAYDRPHALLPGVTLTLHDAGHMLGSAFVVLDIADAEAGRDRRLVFSGDLGRVGLPIIRDPAPLDRADVLIMESTYGDRLHPPYQDDAVRLRNIVNETAQRGGVVMIPAFAVGRTQQVVIQLHQLIRAGEIPPLPIFVDSPLAINVTETFRAHPECYDAEMRAFIADYRLHADDPFGFESLRYTRTVQESMAINDLETPAIIIAPGGMAEHGRILHHLRNRIYDPRNTVLIVGWQAEHTLGRKLVDGVREVRIFGETVHNRARCEVLNGFSGHADRDELLGWVGGMARKPERIFLVHGEYPAQHALIESLGAAHGVRAEAPALGDRVTI
jgi:metallo-beta-lactamase family protein